jgi:hypothetical protein
MSEPSVRDQAPASEPRRFRPLRALIIAALVVILAVAGGIAYLLYAQDREIREALAETDRVDPGWRFDDMEAARADVPDAENGAPLVLKAGALIPRTWLAPPAAGLPDLEMRLHEVPPSERPGDADVKQLRAELSGVAGALDVARELADRPRGRYTVAWTKDQVGTLLPHLEQMRKVTRLLVLDARLRAVDGDMDGALRSCRAALNAARSVGDEPATVSQLTRVSCARSAVRALEQVLALGQASPKALEELQSAFAAEAEEPLELIAARCERVSYYQCLEVMRDGRLDRANYGMRTGPLGATGDNLLDKGKAGACEAAYLRYSNEIVEIAKLPTEQQHERLKSLKPPKEELPALLEGLMRGGEWQRMVHAFLGTKADLRCAAAALAVERYRLAKRQWPDGLAALVPDYVAAVPADPYDGQPLRLRHMPDGLIIYSIGQDLADDGGKLDRNHPNAPGTDVGFRLWNADARGKK